MKRKIQATIYFLKDQFLNIYAHTAKVQGTFCVNHIAKDRAACCQYFLIYKYGSESSIECLIKRFMFDGFNPQTSHDFLYNKRLLGFLLLIPGTR